MTRGGATATSLGNATFASSKTTTETITNGELTIHCNGAALAHQPADPQCLQPENLRVGQPDCPSETDRRRFLNDDPRERQREGDAAKTKE